jgi:hypothetical protein
MAGVEMVSIGEDRDTWKYSVFDTDPQPALLCADMFQRYKPPSAKYPDGTVIDVCDPAID